MAKQVGENCTIEFMQDVPCLYWGLQGAVGGEHFRSAVLQGLDAFRQYKIDNANISLIVDLSMFAPDEIVDIDWVNNDIMPLLYFNNGVRIIALVLPTEEYAKQIASEFHWKTEQLHVVGICSSVEHAVTWIKEGADNQKVIGDYTMFTEEIQSE